MLKAVDLNNYKEVNFTDSSFSGRIPGQILHLFTVSREENSLKH
jgi:hypothetical protein